MESPLIARVEGDAISVLSDWASLWADLLHVDMTLLARSEMPIDGAHLFARRALWEAAVIAYGRTAMSGRRHQRLTDLISAQGPSAETCHKDVMAWRNQHVAHRVDEQREHIEIGAIVDPTSKRLVRLNVRVEIVLGPEDEDDDLTLRFQTHVKALRDQTWEKHFPSLEQLALDEQKDHVEQLLLSATPLETARGFAIDIDPSGRT
jgi:hypothetical protein